MKDPLKKLNRMKSKLWSDKECEVWAENSRYCQVFCLMCNQQYITRIRWDSGTEPLSPRCPKCNSFSWGRSARTKKIEEKCNNGECRVKLVDIHSGEEILKRFMIQEDYSHYFDMGEKE